MTDIVDGGASAGGSSAAVIDPNPVNAPAPVSTSPQAPAETPASEVKTGEIIPPEKKEPAKPVSVRDAVRNAREKLEAQEKAEQEAKSAPKAEQPPAEKKEPAARDQTGKFTPREQQQPNQAQQPAAQTQPQQGQEEKPRTAHRDPPPRFSSDAKAAWETAPEPVKAEIHRAIRELEDGQQKYRQSHERYETIRQFDEIARSNGHELRQSLEKVVAIEQAFSRSPVEGFQRICDHFGINMRALAAHIAGQTPDQVQAGQDQTISELRREIASLKEQVGGVSNTFQQQQQAAMSKEVEAFAADNPRFYDIMDDVTFFLQSGRIDQTLPPLDRLKEAYSLAERLNPAPQAITSQIEQPLRPAKDPDLSAQTAKGSKSISGAPSSGSDPAMTGKPETVSIKEAIKRARAQAGAI